MADGFVEEVSDMGVVQSVNHLPPTTLPAHQAEMAQDAQLMGDGGLLHADGGRELGHREGRAAQAIEDQQPAWR